MSSKTRVFIDTDRPEVMQEILDELSRAKELHPKWPDNQFERLAILTEEVGELAQAMLDYKNGKGGYRAIVEEANQVAAMGLRFRMNIDINEKE